jgi:hypothetical protein
MSDVIFEPTNFETANFEATIAKAKQFGFLEGEWNAICHFPLPDGSWGEGPGSLTASKVLDGCVSLEFFEGPYQGTIIKGLGLRAPRLQSENRRMGTYMDGDFRAGWLPGLAWTI